jgi:hypothetical protein
MFACREISLMSNDFLARVVATAIVVIAFAFLLETASPHDRWSHDPPTDLSASRR